MGGRKKATPRPFDRFSPEARDDIERILKDHTAVATIVRDLEAAVRLYRHLRVWELEVAPPTRGAIRKELRLIQRRLHRLHDALDEASDWVSDGIIGYELLRRGVSFFDWFRALGLSRDIVDAELAAKAQSGPRADEALARLVRVVASTLHAHGVPVTKGRDGKFAHVLVLVLEAARWEGGIPEDVSNHLATGVDAVRST